MQVRLLSFVLVVFFLSACKTAKDSSTITVNLDPVEVYSYEDEYRGSNTRYFDLLHTELHVKFDWQKQHLLGKAVLTLKPYFYADDLLVLDAKGFTINKIEMLGATDTVALSYTYDSLKISINLDKEYTRNDTFNVFISYTARPNELNEGGSKAITSDKGLYFINPLGKDKNKPRQIWTQGETEASSCWFPTIDSPNERTTQDLSITVDKKYSTLSNGLMVSSTENANGTRTDRWVQKLNHTPYLFMMAIGEFAVVKDSWRDIEVNYYVEEEYKEHADAIFGNTPEMLEFFSNVLGVDYPWEKYHQVVVRDYVSGAMENTSASLYMEQVQRTERELMDRNYESIVAHELFHQWFGDLVTCESWSNLPLNESFANYGEYLWIEYKYGKEEAEQHRRTEWEGYLRESKVKKVDLIRFEYADKEDMFDAHSYNKGGLILHHLRDYLGDEAFFEGLRFYLVDNQYSAVEAHQLRLSFEKASGEDLNWFFNQWFFAAGHPRLNVEYGADTTNGNFLVSVEQIQNREVAPTFTLPLTIRFYTKGGSYDEKVLLESDMQTFEFDADPNVLQVSVEPDRLMPVQVSDNKTPAERAMLYEIGKSYREKFEALNSLMGKQGKEEAAIATYLTALKDPFWKLRRVAALNIDKEHKERGEEVIAGLKDLVLNDPHARVRSASTYELAQLEKNDLLPLFEAKMNDTSYVVMSLALKAILDIDEKRALTLAEGLQKEKSASLIGAVATVYAEIGQAKHHSFFEEKLYTTYAYTLYGLLSDYGAYLTNQEPELIIKAANEIKNIAYYSAPWYNRSEATKAIYAVVTHYRAKKKDAMRIQDGSTALEVSEYDEMIDELMVIINDIKAQETDDKVLKRYAKIE